MNRLRHFAKPGVSRKTGAVAAAAVLAFLVAACSSSTSSESTSSAAESAAAATTASSAATSESSGATDSVSNLPETIKITAISEVTGFAGPAGIATQRGQDVAIKEINDSGFLGDSKIQVDFKDTASDPAQGAALLNESIQSGSTMVLGSILSTVAAVEAPIAEKAGVPLIYFSSSSDFADGTNYVWAATPPAGPMFHWSADYIKAQGGKTIAIIYNPDVASTQAWAEDVWPPLAAETGLEIVASEASPATATDATGVVTKVVGAEPDAVVVLASGTANVAIVQALKNANYDGIITGSIGMAGAINALEEQGYGVYWPTNFTNQLTTPEVTKFVDLYNAEYGEAPNNYAAVGYDAVWWLANAIKQADSVDAEEVNAALRAIGEAGFTGTLGNTVFESNVSQAPGLLIEWQDAKEVPVPGFGS